MANNVQLRGASFYATASGTTSATASTTSSTVTYYVTDLSGGTTGGTGGTWAFLANGTTVWQGQGTINFSFATHFRSPGGTVGFLVNGTGLTYANISGYTL